MDLINKLEKISLRNEGLFNNIFSKKKSSDANYLKDAKPHGYFLGNNYVYGMGSDGHVNPFLQSTWSDGDYDWLINAKFHASYMYFLGDKLKFSGKWNNGSFEGYDFTGDSYFFGGEFRGEKFSVNNNRFQATPNSFFSGKWMDYKNGILGVDLYKDVIVDTMNSIELAAVPTNWYVTVCGNGRQVTFKVVKKIDDNNTTFTFKMYPDLKQIQVEWENIRRNYLDFGYIIKGRDFTLLSGYEIYDVDSIVVTNEEPEVKISSINTISFALDPNLKNFLSYKNIPVTIEINSSSQRGKDFVEQFKKDLPKGVFSNVLSKLASYIASGFITGVPDEEFIDLAPIFNNTRGIEIKSENIRQLMLYLNNFIIYVANEATDFDTNTVITESVVKTKNVIIEKIKKILKIDTYIASNKPIRKTKANKDLNDEDKKMQGQNILRKTINKM
jgi:hypothetical protein